MDILTFRIESSCGFTCIPPQSIWTFAQLQQAVIRKVKSDLTTAYQLAKLWAFIMYIFSKLRIFHLFPSQKSIVIFLGETFTGRHQRVENDIKNTKVLCDLTGYRKGHVGFRWRTQSEVLQGRGQFSCGHKFLGHYLYKLQKRCKIWSNFMLEHFLDGTWMNLNIVWYVHFFFFGADS